MIDSIIVFTPTTIALIFACILGVSGVVESVSFTDDAMMVQHNQPFGIAFGGVAFHSLPWRFDHELGHLAQEDLLGALYLPVVGIPSLISAVVNNNHDHRQSWTEVWADGIQ